MTDTDEERKYRGLRRFNLAMGFIHSIQGALMLFLSNDFSVPLQTNFLRFDSVTQTVFRNTETWFELPLGPAIALFLFITAFFHFFLSTVGYGWYKRNLAMHRNPARWYEYSITSSIMIVVIAALCGIWDLAALVPLFAINACMNLFGLLVEVHSSAERTDWTSYWYGTFAGSIPWVIIIIIYFVGAILPYSGTIPDFVYLIIVSLLAFWVTFPINMILQYKKVGRWKDYLYGERMYIILSLVSKTALAWQVFAGTLRPM